MGESSAQSSTHGRLEGLDALRGVAIALVLLRHAWPDVFGGAGIVGVTVFFCLSGYLITGILRREILRTGRISYRRFYRNRALRLLPALIVFLAGFAVIALTVTNVPRGLLVSTLLAGLLYTANLPVFGVAGGMSHLWTLATEEQFYLAWPTLLILAARRGLVRALLVVAIALWAASLAVTLMLRDPVQLYQLPTTWVIALLGGAAWQIGAERLPRLERRWMWIAGTVLAAVCFTPDAKELLVTYILIIPLATAATCALIQSVGTLPHVSQPARWLVWLGTISYATYLWNFLLIFTLEQAAPDQWWAAPAATALTIVVAQASWTFVERPCLRWKDRLERRLTPRVDQAATPLISATR